MVSRLNQVALDREILLRGRLADAVPILWPRAEPSEFISGWVVDAICEHLEAVSKNELKRLVINVPPGCMKSRLTGLIWPCWHWLRYPTERFMFASFDASNTLKQSGDALDITSSPWWKERVGDVYFTDLNQARGEYENTAGGYRIATSVAGKATGKHVHIQAVDDPTKPLEASKENLEKAITWWRGTMATRQADAKRFRRLVIMQRLHDMDLSAFCESEGYEVLRLPMRYEPKACSYTSVGGDLRTTDGELLWPERFPEEAVQTLERELMMHAPAQLQQRPVPEGGSIFKRDWLLREWSVLPAKNVTYIQSWDCAFKEDSDSDYVCGQVWAVCGSEYYLCDQVCEQMSFTATVAAIEAMSRKWPEAVTKLIEDKANGPAVIDTLKDKKKIPGITPVNPEGGKLARANAISGLFLAGNVWLPKAPWVEKYRQEMCSFPRAAHDDQVDATSQALLHLYRNRVNMAKVVEGLNKLEQMQPKPFNPWGFG